MGWDGMGILSFGFNKRAVLIKFIYYEYLPVTGGLHNRDFVHFCERVSLSPIPYQGLFLQGRHLQGGEVQRRVRKLYILHTFCTALQPVKEFGLTD